MKKILTIILFILAILLFFLLAFLGAKNNVEVPLDLLGYQTKLLVAELMAIFLGIGFTFGVIGSFYALGKIKLKRAMADKKAKRLEKQAAKTQDHGAKAASTEAG